jgi:hypothetical protein
MSDASWRRRGVDGRVKPGHDDEGPRCSRKKAWPTGIAIKTANCLSIVNSLDKIGNVGYKYSLKRNRRAWRAAGRERPWLFETLENTTRRASWRERSHFPIFIARNPLKSPDSEK